MLVIDRSLFDCRYVAEDTPEWIGLMIGDGTAAGVLASGSAFDVPVKSLLTVERWPMKQKSRRPILPFPSKSKMNVLWKKHDFNGNGLLSQSEAKEVLTELWPNLAKNAKNCDAVLRMAYEASDDGSGDGLIDKGEFPMMLEYVQYFNRMYGAFKEIDESGDGMIDEDEFVNGCQVVAVEISESHARSQFHQIDEDGGGYVTFVEFCSWAAQSHMGLWHSAKVVAKVAIAGGMLGDGALARTYTVMRTDVHEVRLYALFMLFCTVFVLFLYCFCTKNNEFQASAEKSASEGGALLPAPPGKDSQLPESEEDDALEDQTTVIKSQVLHTC